MRILKTKKDYISLTLIICLSVSMFMNLIYHANNSKYENYLSQKIGNKLRTMGSSINNAKNLLDKINKNKSVTKEELDELYSHYEIFAFGLQELKYMYKSVSKTENVSFSTNPYPFNIYYKLQFLRLDMQKKNKLVYLLSEEDEKDFEMMFEITKSYGEIFGNEYHSWDMSITKDKWVNVIKQLDDIIY